ncbi:MAG: hypothetical protein KY462_03880 [Actinobacteria bacterium]|nr:hypothetical protein [Actinomycetota bacterium]
MPVGSTVTWRWEGRHRHDLIGAGFSAPMQVEGLVAHRFDRPGVYRDACSLHAGMRGLVEVTS